MAEGVDGHDRDAGASERLELGTAGRVEAAHHDEPGRRPRAGRPPERGARGRGSPRVRGPPSPPRACPAPRARPGPGSRGRRRSPRRRPRRRPRCCSSTWAIFSRPARTSSSERATTGAAPASSAARLRGGPAEAGIAGDRGFVNRDGIDEETTVAHHATLGGKGGAHQRARERRPVREQRGHLGGHRPAHGRVDLLEDRARPEPRAEERGRVAEGAGRRRIGKRCGSRCRRRSRADRRRRGSARSPPRPAPRPRTGSPCRRRR